MLLVFHIFFFSFAALQRVASKLEATMALQIATLKREWSDLPTDMLGLILRKLDLFDIIGFRCVCCSWNMAVQSYMASHSYAPPPQNPWLMRLDEDDGKANISFFSHEALYPGNPRGIISIKQSSCLIQLAPRISQLWGGIGT